ncbi:DUF308 domain-containing protein [Streptomyces sp. NPDC051940]|uniref:DUF308 domain-containing protein n=1 Tax=Streptomyces sp. NPDC051940 TaxID=3155675 RepID=UPI00343CCC61
MNTTTDGGRGPLTKLYLIRGVLAVAWAVAFGQAYQSADSSDPHMSLGAVAIVLLVAYPLLDAVSSVIDYRSVPDRVTAFNSALSTLTAVGLGIAGASGIRAVLAGFGAWAVISGGAQFAVGLRRRGPELGKQIPTLVSGGLSFIVGIFYAAQAAGHQPSLSVLSVYATGGGIFFIVQAGLLARKARRGTVQPV